MWERETGDAGSEKIQNKIGRKKIANEPLGDGPVTPKQMLEKGCRTESVGEKAVDEDPIRKCSRNSSVGQIWTADELDKEEGWREIKNDFVCTDRSKVRNGASIQWKNNG